MMQILIKGAPFQYIFCPFSIFILKKQHFFWPKIGHWSGCNQRIRTLWQNLRLVHNSNLFCIIFPWNLLEHGLLEYRSSNLVLGLKMWETLESNLPVWYRYPIKITELCIGAYSSSWFSFHCKHVLVVGCLQCVSFSNISRQKSCFYLLPN